MSLLLLLRPLGEADAPPTDPSPITFSIFDTGHTFTLRDKGHTFTAREGTRMTFKLVYSRAAERPAAEAWIFDDDGSLIDFSSGYTFSLKVGHYGETALLTKTTNITGAAGSGTAPTGTPNVTITWAAGELNLTPGRYAAQLIATTAGLDRPFDGQVTITPSIN